MRGVALGWGVLLTVTLGAATPAAAATTVHILDAFGTPRSIAVRGRVLMDPPAMKADRRRGPLGNLKDTLEAMESDEVPNAAVSVVLAGETRKALTDAEGIFEVEFTPQALLPGTHAVAATVDGPAPHVGANGTGQAFVFPDGPGVLIVSDVDDTVVQTNIRSKRRLVDTVLFKNASQLEQVPGAAEAYQAAVKAGASGVVYLSGSPINFAPRIRAFFGQAGLPDGPLLLKDFGADNPLKQEGYKRRRLLALLKKVPGQTVILVGDSGEKDPEIYRALQQEFPGRVGGIVIRQSPQAPAAPARLTGCTVVNHYAEEPDLLASKVRALRAAQVRDAPPPADR